MSAMSTITASALISAAPTPAEWRAAMGYFPTGVTIVTSWRDGAPAGATINAICSVSLEPPMLLICLGAGNTIREPVEKSGVFGVNILGVDGEAVAARFGAPPEAGRFETCGYDAVEGGAPQLRAAAVFIDCALEDVHAAGDHFIMIGRGVRTRHVSTARPLLYHRGGFPKTWG